MAAAIATEVGTTGSASRVGETVRPTPRQVGDLLDLTGAALVVGPAGSGRSHLLDATEHWARERGRTVVRLHGHHRGGPSATGPLTERCSDPVDLARSLNEGWSRPSILLVDDAHLLDDVVLDALTGWVERRATGDHHVVVAHRCGPVTNALALLASVMVSPAGAVSLGPFTVEDLAAWDDGAAPGADPALRPGPVLRLDVLERTGGWPELMVAERSGPTALADLIVARMTLLEPVELDAVRAVAFGFQWGSPAAVALTGCTSAQIDAVVDAALGAGVLHHRTGPVPAVAEVLRLRAPDGWRIRAAEAVRDHGLPGEVGAVADTLLGLGHRSAAAGGLYVRAASGSAGSPTRRAAVTRAMLDAAVECGQDPAALRHDRARAALADRSPSAALRLVGPTGADRPTDVDGPTDVDADLIRAAAWARLAHWDLAADHYDRAGQPMLAAYAAVGAGRADRLEAEAPTRDGEPDGPQDLTAGLHWWLNGDTRRARRAMERAMVLVEIHQEVDRWPDTPHAALASMLLHQSRASADRAARVLAEAERTGVGGEGFVRRHRLLGAWSAIREGRLEEARLVLAAEAQAGDHGPGHGGGRDEVLSASLGALAALLGDDPTEVAAAFAAIEPMVDDLEVDPLAVPVAAAVAVLAARAGADADRVTERIDALVAGLGHPPMLAAWAAWTRLMVAATADDAEAVARAATELEAGADDVPAEVGALRRAAAAYNAVLAGEVEPSQVTAAAEDLIDHGMSYEARRLLGAGALRSRDPKAARDLLARVRRLQPGDGSGPGRSGVALSARELEVAEALTTGLTHKEIGAQLYISAKTVEHHVARIRQKLGGSTRSELLAAIREVLAESAQTAPTEDTETGSN